MINKHLSHSIHVFPSRDEMGHQAGKDVESQIEELLRYKESIRMIFAAAPSQNELLNYLSSSEKIDWQRIIAFHMDEYLGLDINEPASFGTFLNQHIFGKVRLKEVYFIDGKAPTEDEIKRYSELITKAPVDIVCLGIGENGHIAFNDPPVADFNDPKTMKLVKLDEKCRVQQVNDKCFETLDEVPKEAFTLTIPTLMKADFLFCVVPGKTKQEAVYNTLKGPVSTNCPASILRQHPNCQFYFDEDSYHLVREK